MMSNFPGASKGQTARRRKDLLSRAILLLKVTFKFKLLFTNNEVFRDFS